MSSFPTPKGSVVRKAVDHFLAFHQGNVNVIAHVIGFVGIFYSILRLNWILFALFIIVLEFGHVYNHFTGIRPYDFRPKTFFWRTVIFLLVVWGFYLLSINLQSLS